MKKKPAVGKRYREEFMRRTTNVSYRQIVATAAGVLLGFAAFAAPAAAQMKEVNFIVVNNLFSTPAFVAVENGYWEKQGLNVKIKLTASGSQVTKALQAGEAQFGHAALSTTIASARAGGNMLTGVMPYFNAAEYVALGGRAIIGRKDRGIDAANPKSMEGKKIGYLRGSTNDVYLRQWFKKNKLDVTKSTLINLPVADMPISITQGVVDAVVPWEPYSAQAIRELGSNAVIMSRSEEGLVSDVIGVVANQDWIKNNYDLLEKFSVGVVQAAQFIRQNPRKAAEIDTRYIDGMNIEDAVEGFKTLHWDPRMSVCTIEGTVAAGNQMIKDGLIKQDKPFVPADFIDMTVLNRVQQKHPELFADLPKLPTKLADCKGQLVH
jgi:NitT/TauT family transport system substrate-binding protein/sulfonate transport system substrate-binding protein